jgi:hypothetical protein
VKPACIKARASCNSRMTGSAPPFPAPCSVERRSGRRELGLQQTGHLSVQRAPPPRAPHTHLPTLCISTGIIPSCTCAAGGGGDACPVRGVCAVPASMPRGATTAASGLLVVRHPARDARRSFLTGLSDTVVGVGGLYVLFGRGVHPACLPATWLLPVAWLGWLGSWSPLSLAATCRPPAPLLPPRRHRCLQLPPCSRAP